MRQLIHRLKSDEALMLAYQRGDVAAFDSLYRRHKDGLFTFLYRSCPRQAIVEELAQEAWEGVIDAAARYHPDARFRTWLYRIAHNRLVDFWRRRDNRMDSLEGVPEPVATGDGAAELRQAVMEAVAALPGEQRDALLLQEQGFSLGDIAAITGAERETVKSRLRYARRQLRERLGDEL